MKNWLLVATSLFALFIILIVVGADRNQMPPLLERIYNFPNGDKAGHFILFGILSFLLNRTTLIFFPTQSPARLILTISLLLSIVIALEEWSQALFPSRTMSLIDLLASFGGVIVAAILVWLWRPKQTL